MMKRVYILILLLAGALSTASTASAREVYPLNDDWLFFFKSDNDSDRGSHITLPHTWNSDALGQMSSYLQTTANYSKTITIPQWWLSRRIFLRFNGVATAADLFVNGRHVGEHRGGATAFTFEITDKVIFGSDNTILVVVSNAFRSDILPTSSAQNNYGGIYRDVELIVTPSTTISPLFYGTDGVLIHQTAISAEKADCTADVYLTARSGGSTACRVTLNVDAPDGTRVVSRSLKAKIDHDALQIPFTVEQPQLWSPSSPSLYKVTVATDDNGIRDSISFETGFRDIRAYADSGLKINDKRINVRGVVLHHDRPTVCNAMSRDDYDADLEIIRSMGANAIRSATMPHAQYLYDLCDRTGMLVWIDAPFVRANFMGDIAYFPTTAFRENGLTQLREIIAQNYNHPSVVMWGIFSNIWQRGDDTKEYIEYLNRVAHEMDASRPTVACSNQDGDINFITDLIVWQQNVGWERGSFADIIVWRDMLHRNWSHLRSAVCYGEEGDTRHLCDEITKATPNAMLLPERRQTAMHEAYADALGRDSLLWGVWVNSMFDFGSARAATNMNRSGVVEFDRRTKKDAYYLYRALWRQDTPTLYLPERRWTPRNVDVQQIRIYSSAKSKPLLTVNADTVNVRYVGDCQYLSDSLKRQGIYRVRVSADALSDSMTITAGNVLKQRRSLALPRKAGL